MKACKYCGCENDDQVAHCGDCGSSKFKSKAHAKIGESVSAVQPAPVTPEALIGVAKGPLITRITCRTPREAALVIMELESADIIGIVENEVVQETGVSSIADRQIPVLTSTKAYEAASELHAAMDPIVFAKAPLPQATRCLMMFLPILMCGGVLMFLLIEASYEHSGEERRAREARLWFARGLALWVLGGVLVWAALAVLR